ncbi:nectin-2 isoform X1 [Amia ocellicauda]|uniref:nectin-2 isoform X1 n=1 Tax=Amia ocellicauda TaxID=2972642 RepID=UPI003463C208
MAKEYALDRATGRNRHPLVLLLLVLLQGAQCQRVKVDPEVQAYPGQNVTLRCQFVQDGQAKLTQVSWIWEPPVGSGMEKVNVAVFHPQFKDSYPNSPLKGRISFLAQPASLEAPSIQIQGVQLTDEGKFICEFATYPNGNEQGIANLIMLAKPVNSAKVITVTAGDSPVTVARCESANGKPAAQLSWVTALVGNGTLTSVNNANGTVTVRSEYWLTPSGKDDGMDLSCVVSHPTLDLPQSFPLKLAVEYPPQVEIIGYDENWYMGRTNAILHCKATGNPPPTNITWKTLSGEKLPETVKVNGNQLTVQKVDETVNTTFVCEVSNRMGPSKSHLTVAVRETPPVTDGQAGMVAGAVIGTLLALLLVCALVAVLYTRQRRQRDGYRGNQGCYDIKTRVFGGKKGNRNGAGIGGGIGGTGVGLGGNGSGPLYTYGGEGDIEGLGGKSSSGGQLHQAGPMLSTTPTAHDILLGGEMDEAERRKFDGEGEEDEGYDHFDESRPPLLQLRGPPQLDLEPSGYLDDDMESQRDGSVISRTAVYV